MNIKHRSVTIANVLFMLASRFDLKYMREETRARELFVTSNLASSCGKVLYAKS